MKVHVVVKGDTLWKISRQYGIPFEELKRVNAHLANPEYVVPGMKIFLPEKHTGGTKAPVKGGEKGKVPVKPGKPIPLPEEGHKPVPPKPTPPKPVPPKPTPPVPVPPKPIPPKPIPPVPVPPRPTPPVPVPPKPTPPVPVPPKPIPPVPVPPKPTPPVPVPPRPIPPVMPMPPQPPTNPCIHQIFAIPCGWMPIFDADCHPFIHPGQIQHVPMPPAPEPMPFPMHQRPAFGIEDETCLESPEHIPMPIPMPLPNTVPHGWKMLESPEFMFEESPIFNVPPPQAMPEFYQQIESPMQEECIDEQFQQPAMHHYPPMQFPVAPWGCTPVSHCGCGGLHSMPMQMQMPMPGNHCNACNQPIQHMPYQMMPFPQQGYNWPGTY